MTVSNYSTRWTTTQSYNGYAYNLQKKDERNVNFSGRVGERKDKKREAVRKYLAASKGKTFVTDITTRGLNALLEGGIYGNVSVPLLIKTLATDKNYNKIMQIFIKDNYR